MKNKLLLISILVSLITFLNGFSQNKEVIPVEYKIIAEGTDSPIPNLQVVCLNKFFNKDFLPIEFWKKYNLDEKTLYKKNMLIEIFHSDKKKQGLDKINLIQITQDQQNIIVEYNIENSKTSNDDLQLSPFLIIQISKAKKKVTFIANGVELGKANNVYVD